MDETDETNELEEPLAMRATVSYDDGQVRVTLLNRVGKERFAEIAEATGLRWRPRAGPGRPVVAVAGGQAARPLWGTV